MTNMKMLAAAAVVALMLSIWMRPKQPHSEEALLSDWSDPPPWPIFIGVNFLARSLRAMSDALIPPPIRMLDYGFAYQTSILAHICQSTKIPDYLATGPKTISQLADYLETKDQSRIERFMFACAADGITKLDPSTRSKSEPRFVNSALSATLRTDHPSSLRGMLGHLVQDGLESFGKLHELFGPDAKENVWNEVFTDYAFEGGGLWKLFADFPEREEQFTRAMLSLELLGGKAMARDVPFHKFQRVVDIGGNLGHFLHKIMTLNPQGKGVLFDRPQVLAHAKEYWFEQEGMYHDGTEKRLEMVEGSFFEANDIPDAQDGDVYLMRYILHNWGHEECLKILSNLKSKMQGKKATLMIGESSIPDRDTVGVPNAMYKIDMHMMNLFGHPLDRTPQQWKDLLDEAGFEFVAIHPTRSLIHFVEAIPLP